MSPLLPALREHFQNVFAAWLLKVYRKPLQFLLVLVILPVALIVAVTYQTNLSLARQQALNNLRMTAQVASEAVARTLDEVVLFEQLIVSRTDFIEAVSRHDQAQATMLLQQALPLLPGADRALLATTDGKIMASTANLDAASLASQSVVDQEVFQGAKENNWQPYVSSVHVRDEQTFEKVVDVAVPVAQDGSVSGILFIEFQVDVVRSWVQKIRVEPEGFLYVVDQQSQLVVYPFQVLPGKPKRVADWPPVAQPLTTQGWGLSFHDRREGRQWLAGAFPIGEIGWRVVAVQPETAVVRVVYRVLATMGVLVVILLVLVVIVSLRWAALQALNMRLLQQNAKLLKQSQQRWTLEHGKPPQDRSKGTDS